MPNRVSPAEANQLLAEGFTYVDVRSEDEYASCHPAGAVNIPVVHVTPAGRSPNPEFAEAFEATFPKGSKVILGCASGVRSMKAAAILEERGWDDLYECRSGFGGARDPSGRVVEAGWQEAGLPCEEGQPEGRSWGAIQKKL